MPEDILQELELEGEEPSVDLAEGDQENAPNSASDDEVDNQLSAQPFRVVYQSNNFLLPQLKDLILDGEVVNIRPEYQRRLRWTNLQKSLLIESLLLNVPVPPVFFYESDLARYEVMDGQQRLNAIKEFLNNEFSLRGLTVLSTLNGRRYAKLPPKIKRSLDRASISAIIVLQESQGRLLNELELDNGTSLGDFVFERLNTGGTGLNAQEIRNAIYGGPFNDMIIMLARDPLFTRIWGIPPYTKSDPNEYYEEPARQRNTLYKRMIDCQLVLRFFALEKDEYIEGAMRGMLDRCMERHLDEAPNSIELLTQRYRSRLSLANELFDGNPFILGAPSQTRLRPVAGAYDAVIVSLHRLWERREAVLRNKSAVQEAYVRLVNETADSRTLTGAANTAGDIRRRIALVHDTILAQI